MYIPYAGGFGLNGFNIITGIISQVESLEETVAVEEDIELQEKRNADFAIMEHALNGALGALAKDCWKHITCRKKI